MESSRSSSLFTTKAKIMTHFLSNTTQAPLVSYIIIISQVFRKIRENICPKGDRPSNEVSILLGVYGKKESNSLSKPKAECIQLDP